MENKKTILLVDDEVKITQVLTAYLEKAGYQTVCAHDGKEASRLLQSQSFSLIILDLMLPDISGESLCRTIRTHYRTPVIMLTAKSEEADILDGLQLGADDYITKPFSPKIVVAKVETILRRTESDFLVSAPISYGNGFLQIDYQNMLVRRQGEIIHLTPTEYQILFTMAKAPHRIFTRDQLISFALNDDFGGYDRSIDIFIKSIRSKIEPDRKKPIFIITVHGLGYQFLGRKDTGENECEHCELK